MFEPCKHVRTTLNSSDPTTNLSKPFESLQDDSTCMRPPALRGRLPAPAPHARPTGHGGRASSGAGGAGGRGAPPWRASGARHGGASLPVGQPGEAVWLRPGTSPGTSVGARFFTACVVFVWPPTDSGGSPSTTRAVPAATSSGEQLGSNPKALGIFPVAPKDGLCGCLADGQPYYKPPGVPACWGSKPLNL